MVTVSKAGRYALQSMVRKLKHSLLLENLAWNSLAVIRTLA